MDGRFKQAWHEWMTELFDKEGLDTMFQHARNVLTGTAVVAAGMYAAKHLESTQTYGLWTAHFAGYAVAFLGAVLLGLNLIDGLRRLAKRRHHVVLRFVTIVIYTAISVRLTQVIIYFRSVT